MYADFISIADLSADELLELLELADELKRKANHILQRPVYPFLTDVSCLYELRNTHPVSWAELSS